jgi:hypothetical protein
LIYPEEQDRRDREREAKRAEESLQKSDEDLLKEIFYCSSAPMSHNSTTTISRTFAHFSALLVRLSRKTEESTKQNIEIQKKLTCLTNRLFWLTIILLFIALLQILLPYINPPVQENKQRQISIYSEQIKE